MIDTTDAQWRRANDPSWSGYAGPGSQVYDRNRMHRYLDVLFPTFTCSKALKSLGKIFRK